MAGSSATRITLADGVTQMDRDIVLSLELKKDPQPTVQVTRGPNGDHFLAVTFLPEFTDAADLRDPPAADVVFVLDCSGSMMGQSIREATTALELCLRSLSAGDTFNICRFGSTFELMRSESLVYSPHTLDAALRYIRGIVDLGGTELYAPLEAILRVAPRAGAVRQIVLLTDGEVSNEAQLIELARAKRAHNRIFSFGIGSAASSFLVKGLARATGGAAEFIAPGERIEDKVLRTFSRMASPMIRDVAIDWGNADVQTLAEIPPVFDGDALAIFGRALGSAPAAVTLTCVAPTGPMRWTLPVPRAVLHDGGTIATTWARRAIQSLEEVNGDLRSAASLNRSRERDKLIGLSKEFNLACGLTSFIAIEHRSLEERNEGRPALRRVPVQLAHGWGESQILGEFFGGPVSTYSRGRAMIDKTMDRTIDRLRDSAECASSPKMKSSGWGLFGRARRTTTATFNKHAPPAPRAAPTRPASPRDPLHAVLGTQSAEGWFEWTDELEKLLVMENKSRDACRAAIEEGLAAFDTRTCGSSDVGRIISTVLALWLLRHRFAADARLWDRAAVKARRWLAAETGHHAYDINPWLERIEAHLRA